MLKKILIVDDEKEICSVLKKYFSDKGHTVFACHEAGEALNALRTQKPNTLILDIRMPGLNGIEVLKLAKEIDHNIQVFMVSAIKEDLIVKEAMNLGATGYFTKPFSLEELEKAMLDKPARPQWQDKWQSKK